MYSVGPTMTVYLLPSESEDLNSFKCRSCEKTAFQYVGAIKLVIPGDFHSTQLAPSVILCGCKVRTGYGARHRCKYLYSSGFALSDLATLTI